MHTTCQRTTAQRTLALSTGPPLLPLLMAASVCTASSDMQPWESAAGGGRKGRGAAVGPKAGPDGGGKVDRQVVGAQAGACFAGGPVLASSTCYSTPPFCLSAAHAPSLPPPPPLPWTHPPVSSATSHSVPMASTRAVYFSSSPRRFSCTCSGVHNGKGGREVVRSVDPGGQG